MSIQGLQNIDKRFIITCPHCRAEYHSGEIYMPGALIGQSYEIVKDALGKIIYIDFGEDKEPNLVEHFTCEYCNKPFVVEATVTYKNKEEVPEKDFSTEYVSLF